MSEISDTLRDAKNLLKKKQRLALREDQKAYRKAYGIRRLTNGNSRKRRKGTKAATPAIDGSIPEIGRGTGIIGTGSETIAG